MKRPYYKLVNIFFLIIIVWNQLPGQSKYEIFVLQKDYGSLLTASSELNDTTDYYYHAYALDQTGNAGEAIRILEQAIANFGSVPSLEMAVASLYYRMGRYSTAKSLLYKYQSMDEYFLRLIRVLEFESDYKQAIKLLEARLQTDSLNLEYLIRLADNYEADDRILSARDTYIKIIELNNRDIVSMSKLANIYLKTQIYDGAINLCEEALAIDSTNRTIIKIRGLAAFRKGEFDLAETSFLQLLELGDTTLVNLKHLGISESKGYRFSSSIRHLEMAYNMDSTDYEICFFLGRGYASTSKLDSGLFYLDLADTLVQPSPAVLAAIMVEKASTYYAMKDYKKALLYYEKAYDIKQSPDFLFFMASLYRYQLNNPKKALELYEQFLSDLEPKESNKRTTNQRQSISLKNTAERGVEELKEELFFKGELNE